MNSTRKFSYAFKIAIIISSLIGLISNSYHSSSLISLYSFYTMQSNVIVFLFYFISIIVLLINPEVEKSKSYHALKGAVLMIILLTFCVYISSLAPINFNMDVTKNSENLLEFSNVFVHLLVPILVLFDYLLFDKKGYWKKKYIPIWCIFPIIYLIYVYIYSALGGIFFKSGGSRKYAYFFLDIDNIGISGVIFYILLIAVCYILLCYLFVALDNQLYKRKCKKQLKL